MVAARWMVLVLLVMSPLAARADVVVLTDGSMLSGQVALAEDTVTVSNAAGEFAVPRARVASVRPGVPAASPSGPAARPMTVAVPGSAPLLPYAPVDAAGAAYTAQNPYNPYVNAQWPYGYGVSVAGAVAQPGYGYGNPYAIPDWNSYPAGSYAQPYPLPVYQPPVTTQAVSTPYDQLLQVTGAAAPLRRGPGTQYAIIHSVNRDDVLYRVAHADGWYQVITRSGQAGWINAEAVAAMGNGPDLTPHQWDFRVNPPDLLVTTPTLNVRSGPGLSYPVIDNLYRNDVVATIAREGEWTRISYLDPVGHTGWVHRQYVTDIYRQVKMLLVRAQYDEVAAIGDAALPALQELLNSEDWRVRAAAARVMDKVIANRAFVPGLTSFNYERTAADRAGRGQ